MCPHWYFCSLSAFLPRCKKPSLSCPTLHLLRCPLHCPRILRIKDPLWRTKEHIAPGRRLPPHPPTLPPEDQPETETEIEIGTERETETETEKEIGIGIEIGKETETGLKGGTKTKRRKNTRGGRDRSRSRGQGRRANTRFPVPTGDPTGPGKIQSCLHSTLSAAGLGSLKGFNLIFIFITHAYILFLTDCITKLL